MDKKLKNKKGLAAIFGEGIEDIMDEIEGKAESKEPTKNISIKDIISNPYQPRKQFDQDKLLELANSFKEHGVFTPIMVKKATAGKYYLIAGERRTRAAKIAGLETIPAIIKDISDHSMQEIALLENIQRENLNPIEEAISYKSVMTKQKITQDELSKKIGKSRSYIANTLRLLKLDDKIIQYVISGKLSFGHVKPLISLNKELSIKIALRSLTDNLTVREVEDIVKGYQLKNSPRKGKVLNKHYEYVEGLFRNKIKSRVMVKNNKIIIPFKNDESLNKIIKKLDLTEDE